MDINKAVEAIEAHLEKLKADDDSYNPSEIRVRPSGDDADHIKVWLNFPDAKESELEGLKKQTSDSIGHLAEVAEFQVEVRAESDSD